MPAQESLGRIVIQGYRSIRDLDLELTSDVTVLIGANGSGKSNLVSALELISRVWDDTFQNYLTDRGGIAPSLRDEDGAARITIFGAGTPGCPINGYRVVLALDDDDAPRVTEDLLSQQPSHDHPFWERISRSDMHGRGKTVPHEGQGKRTIAYHVAPIVSGCRAFHFDDVSPNAPVRQYSNTADDLALHSDALNIGPFLLKTRENHPHRYEQIVSTVRSAAPFFEDFVLEPNQNDRLRLRWRQRGLDRVFSSREMSDGTLRFVCLATLLLGPDLPSTVVLDEPELGLHPAAITLLAEMIHAAGRMGHRVLVATQSVSLLSHFEIGEVLVLNRVDGATVTTRPDPEILAGFLEEYSVGALWEMNLLTGHPSFHEQPIEVIR
ncbi:chromosome segregation protein SMC [Actinomyces sp. 432]|uniref:AAA family ATPase n=1 Tax=Actinomyces sp. 432 TaxID=2057798 RepID=UPI001373ADD7|nr:AAA family ATPase [Actinomyces sp. 432]QHO91425.1 chromosome segregation protein SMC [Actinomyces sp. 432]